MKHLIRTTLYLSSLSLLSSLSPAADVLGYEHAALKAPFYATVGGGSQKFTCAGALISPEYVLMNASCLHRNGTSLYAPVIIGDDEQRIKNRADHRMALAVTFHPGYDLESSEYPESAPYDYALITLNRPSYKKPARVVPVSTEEDDSWHLIGPGKQPLSPYLDMAYVSLRNAEVDEGGVFTLSSSQSGPFLVNGIEFFESQCESGSMLVRDVGKKVYRLVGFTGYEGVVGGCAQDYMSMSAVKTNSAYAAADWIREVTGWDPVKGREER